MKEERRGLNPSSERMYNTRQKGRTLLKKALITGITGQDGSYLAEFLLSKGYKVFGMTRRSSVGNLDRIEHIRDNIKLIYGDLSDQSSLDEAVKKIKPDEVYNLAAQSFVPVSFTQPGLTGMVTGLGATYLLEAVRKNHPEAKFYQASTSEMYGNALETPQTELTPFYPRSPYGVAKVYAHWITVNYRESYDMFACCGILFNHESPRRGLEFVSRKITHGVAKIKKGLAKTLRIGNLSAQRDWGFAGDYVEAMWMMLQQPQSENFVIATGKSHSVQDLLDVAFGVVGLNPKKYVEVDKSLYRPAEVNFLVGDAQKARKQLKWKPKISFEEMIEMMVHNDLKLLSSH